MPNRSNQPDSAVLDEEFFEALFREYSRLMYDTAQRYRTEGVDPGDVVQESLLSLLKREALLKSFSEETLASYIYYTVKNTAITQQRKRAKIERAELPMQEDPPETEPVPQLNPAEIHVELESVLNRLSESERLLLTYKYLLDDSNEEIAERFGWKPDSVRMMLTRARRNAQKLLNGNGGEQG